MIGGMVAATALLFAATVRTFRALDRLHREMRSNAGRFDPAASCDREPEPLRKPPCHAPARISSAEASAHSCMAGSESMWSTQPCDASGSTTP